MSIFRKVTFEILKKNKTRTIVTIIGIILSASMFTAVTTTISSVQNYLLKNAYYNYGDWHISALEVDKTFFDFLKNPVSVADNPKEPARFAEGKVESYVYSQQIGYAIAEGCTNAYKPYLYVIGADKNFCETMPVHLTGGRLPEKADEILLPEHLAENGEVRHKVGDVLTLEIGNRVSDGFVLGQYNPYMNADELENPESIEETQERETLEVEETRTYTVVGFYERPNFENYSAPGYTAITVMDKVRPDGSLYNFYFKMEDPKDAFLWSSDISAAIGCNGNLNDNVLTYLGVIGHEGFYVVLYGLAAIVCGLIMFGSVSLIYNAFSISVSERTKQFGLLSSIGATKKQIRKMVFFEALFVSGIGIPLGILAGIAGMGVTFHFIGKEFSALTHYPIPLTLSVYPISLVAACVITLSTVMISAWIPSKRATMVTAVEAIRQSGDVKLSKRELKKLRKVTTKKYLSDEAAKAKRRCSSQEAATIEQRYLSEETAEVPKGERFVYRLFGFPGMIADKYYKRSKRKYRTTVVSLFMSIVLFISASALTSYLTDAMEKGLERNGYDIMYHYDPTAYMTEEEILEQDFSKSLSRDTLSELLEEAEAVTGTTYVNRRPAHVDISNQYLSESFVEYMMEKVGKSGSYDENGFTNVYVSTVFVEDAVYEEFLKEQKLDKHVYMNSEAPLGIAVDGNTFYDYSIGKYITTNVLKSANCEVVLSNETETAVLQVGAIVEQAPYFVSDMYQLSIVYPYSLRESVLQGLAGENVWCDYYILSDDHKESFKDIKQRLVEHGLSKNSLYDYAEGVEENRTLVKIINVFAYGFIVLISLIAAANVFNTISTNIHLRRREFAMLKSVGMSNKEMNRMMNFECILYGSRALLYGIPVSIMITWLIYLVVSEGFTTGFYLPWSAIGIAVCSVFLVVFATMMYSMEKIKKDNPIDALKNENL